MWMKTRLGPRALYTYTTTCMYMRVRMQERGRGKGGRRKDEL